MSLFSSMNRLIERSTNKAEFIKALSKVNIESCPHDFNFHLHTHYSDGQADPMDTFRQAIELGVQGMAITDHHSTAGYEVICQWLHDSQQDVNQFPYLWTGVEITSTLLAVDVHILGFAFDPSHPKMQPYVTGEAPMGALRQAENVIDTIQQAGGVAILAHPDRYRLEAEILIEAALKMGLDGIEAYYCYRNTVPWQPSQPQTNDLLQISDRHNLLVSCGTDSHGLDMTRRR